MPLTHIELWRAAAWTSVLMTAISTCRRSWREVQKLWRRRILMTSIRKVWTYSVRWDFHSFFTLERRYKQRRNNMYFYKLLVAITTANYATRTLMDFFYWRDLVGKQFRIEAEMTDSVKHFFIMQSARCDQYRTRKTAKDKFESFVLYQCQVLCKWK